VHKKCFLANLCKEEEAEETTVGSPRTVGKKESIDIRNVVAGDKEKETHICVVKRREASDHGRCGSEITKASKKYRRIIS
jgi:hypothetical protein